VLNDGSIYYGLVNGGGYMRMPAATAAAAPAYAPANVTVTVVVPSSVRSPYVSVSIMPQPDANMTSLVTAAVRVDGDVEVWNINLSPTAIALQPLDAGGGGWRLATGLISGATAICNPTATASVCTMRGQAPYTARSVSVRGGGNQPCPVSTGLHR